VSFRDLRDYHCLESAVDVREALSRAGATFKALDPSGMATNEDMKQEYDSLVKAAHKSQAGRAFEDTVRYRSADKMYIMLRHLDMAGARIDDIAVERGLTKEDVIDKVVQALRMSPDRPDARNQRGRGGLSKAGITR
jgi:hypothetical protein